MEQITNLAQHANTIVFVNPNNPTGTTLPTRDLHAFAAAHPKKRIVIDESFIEFSSEPSIIDALEKSPLDNVLVLKSLSKTLGVPGLRLGHAYTSDVELQNRIRAKVPIWNLGSPGEFFLELLLKFRPELTRSLQRSAADREDLIVRLRALPQIEQIHPSGGNFVLARLRGSDPSLGRWLVDTLLARFKIYLKDVSDRFKPEAPWLRFAVRVPADHQRLCEALAQVLP
jgi:histidinol-phosphate/aromatic aminotransferase/cobyric acid decarboxylase-like protein